MKNLNLILVVNWLLLGCATKTTTVYVDAHTLPMSELYNSDTVSKFFHAYEKENKTFSEFYFTQAEEFIETNPDKAIHALKRAISLRPSEKYYRKLADILFATKQYEELNRLWSMVVYQNEAGDSKVFSTPSIDDWAWAFKSSILARNYIANEDVYLARDFGVDLDVLRDRVLADKDLALDTGSLSYKTLWLQMEASENLRDLAKQTKIISAFFQSAEDSSSSFSIDQNSVNQFQYSSDEGEYWVSSLSSVFVYLLPESEGKEYAWMNYNIKHVFSPSAGLKAVVCAIDTSALGCPREMRHIYHRLLVYDANHQLVDHRVIAVQSAEQLQLATVNKNIISISEFKRVWQKPYEKEIFDNEIKNMVETGVEQLRITPEGKIVSSSLAAATSI